MRKLSMMEILSARRLDALTHVQISELDLFIKDLGGVCFFGFLLKTI